MQKPFLEARAITRAKAPHVALLIESSSSWGSGMLAGIAEYIRRDAWQPWVCHWRPWGKQDRLMLPDEVHFDGVIARVTHEALAEQLHSSGIPSVNLSWYRFPDFPIPRCTSDEAATGKMVADYLVSLRYENFAYCPASERTDRHDRLGSAFRHELSRAGYACHMYKPAAGVVTDIQWIDQIDRIADWLQPLPKPIAVLAFDNAQARIVTQACAMMRLDVPRDVAVMGGEHDKISSALSQPPLTSIDLSEEKIGFEAARLLEALMGGAAPPSRPTLIPPSRIVPRQSTDWLASDDEIVSDALKYMEAKLDGGVEIRTVAEEIGVSRRTLEQRFKRSLGRSPAEALRRLQAQLAAQLLCDTRLQVAQIAHRCGFDRAESLTRCF